MQLFAVTVLLSLSVIMVSCKKSADDPTGGSGGLNK